LYWAAVDTASEAKYLCSVLNSKTLLELVRPFQVLGLFGPRHFDKYIWLVPIPVFDSASEQHRLLANLGEQAEAVAAEVEIPSNAHFRAARTLIHNALNTAGVSDNIESAVSDLLA
jgi:hypothetical protein